MSVGDHMYGLCLEYEAIDNRTHPMIAKVAVIYDKYAWMWPLVFGEPPEQFQDGADT